MGTQIDQSATKVADIFSPTFVRKLSIPLVLGRVSAGFPSPADDFIESRLDLNDYLIRRPAATFFVRVRGESMIGAGIHDGDLLVVDRAETADIGRVVIACLDGELLVKRLARVTGVRCLVAEGEGYPAIAVTEETQIWGVVVAVIHRP